MVCPAEAIGTVLPICNREQVKVCSLLQSPTGLKCSQTRKHATQPAYASGLKLSHVHIAVWPHRRK